MVPEQDVMRLKEAKRRMEMLISYYRELGEKDHAFVQDLEVRLRGVASALGGNGDSCHC